MKIKPHSSWKKEAIKVVPGNTKLDIELRKMYLKGASDFQNRTVEALDKFKVLTNAEIFQHDGKLIVHLEDIIADTKVLIKGLYAPSINKK